MYTAVSREFPRMDGSGSSDTCSQLAKRATNAWEFTVSKFELVDAGSDAIALATTVFLSNAPSDPNRCDYSITICL